MQIDVFSAPLKVWTTVNITRSYVWNVSSDALYIFILNWIICRNVPIKYVEQWFYFYFNVIISKSNVSSNDILWLLAITNKLMSNDSLVINKIDNLRPIFLMITTQSQKEDDEGNPTSSSTRWLTVSLVVCGTWFRCLFHYSRSPLSHRFT